MLLGTEKQRSPDTWVVILGYIWAFIVVRKCYVDTSNEEFILMSKLHSYTSLVNVLSLY